MTGLRLAAAFALVLAAPGALAGGTDPHTAAGDCPSCFTVPGTGYTVVPGVPHSEPASGQPTRDLVAAVAHWVSSALALPPPETLPKIAFATPQQLAALRHGAEFADAGPQVIAIYDPTTQTIHLAAGWTGSTPVELSVLVHEMVHHLQAVTGQRFACPAEREQDAFAVQAQWLALFGSDLEAAFGIDPFTLFVRTVCGV